MATAAQLLLRITGDSTDARQAVGAAARDVADFGRKRAEATIDVKTAGANAEIERTKQKLRKLAEEPISPRITIQQAAAVAQLERLEAKLALLGRKRVEIDVDVNRNGFGRTLVGLGKIGLAMPKIIASFATFGLVGKGVGESLEGVTENMGTFQALALKIGVGAPAIAAGIGALGAVVVGLAGALTALVGSLGAAALGLGALGVAGGGALAGGLALGIGAVQRFKAQADIAGTAANALKTSAQGLGKAFKDATAGGADAIFRGLSTVLQGMRPNVEALKGAFTGLGRSIGSALKDAAPAVKGLVTGFGELITSMRPLMGPVVQGLTSIGQILLNIANAAMPYLVEGARNFAAWLGRIAEKTKGLNLEGVIAHLTSWWNLAKAVGGVMVEFLSQAAGHGKGLVDQLARGASELLKWMQSEEGRRQINEFFTKTLPMIIEFVKLAGELAVKFISFVTEVAPALATFFGILRGLLDQLTLQIFSFGGAWDSMKTAASDAAAWVKKAWGDATAFLSEKWASLKEKANSAWNSAKTTITNAVNGAVTSVKTKWTQAKTWVATQWDAIKTKASTTWNSIKSAVTNAVQGAVTAVKTKWTEAKARISSIWGSVKSTAARIWNEIKTTVSEKVRGAVQAVRDKASSMVGAGKALIQGLIDGITQKIGQAVQKVKDGVQKIRNLLPGSEPKDASSPLRNLGHAGRAVMDNFAAGIAKGASGIPGALSSELGATVNATVGSLSGPSAAAGTSIGAVNYNLHAAVQGTGGSDPDLTLALFDRKLRAMGGLVPGVR